MFFTVKHDTADVIDEFEEATDALTKNDGEDLLEAVAAGVAEALSDSTYKVDYEVDGDNATIFATPAGADVRPLTTKDLKMDNAVLTFSEFPLGVNGKLRDLLSKRYWTIRTIPVFPELENCELLYREARRDEVERIEALRQMELALITEEFARAGKKPATGAARFTMLASVRVVEDVEFNLQRRSLGLVPSLDSRLTRVNEKVATIANEKLGTFLP